MKIFITEEFLLHSDIARQLYHEFAAPQPIFDYHTHLSPQDIASNRRFDNLHEAWLEGDHYKWRAMRWNGIPERFCTGDASPKDKFLAYARSVPQMLRNLLGRTIADICFHNARRFFDLQMGSKVFP